MADLDSKLDQMCADGRITTEDADEVRNFSSFLRATAGIPRKAASRTPAQQAAFIEVYRKHYPEDYARAVAEQQARKDCGRLPARQVHDEPHDQHHRHDHEHAHDHQDHEPLSTLGHADQRDHPRSVEADVDGHGRNSLTEDGGQ